MPDWIGAAGRTLMVGLPGPELDPGTRERLHALAPAGAILFARNLDSPRQTINLLDELRRALPSPPLLAIDQEGGRVSRLEPFAGETPTAEALTRAGESAARRFGAATADALRTLGFNVDFAPVVDLCGPEATNGIGDRSFGTDPELVARLAGSFLDGLQKRGVAGCLKHFPGLGDTAVDSHAELPTVTRPRAELDAADLIPFRRLRDRAASVMVGHGHYVAVDGPRPVPASLSRRVVHELLRNEIGYSGLVISDDLEMGAVAGLDDDGRAAVRAIHAGCDLLLYCSDLDRAERALAALAEAAAGNPDFGERLIDAGARVRRSAERWSATAGDAHASSRALEALTHAV